MAPRERNELRPPSGPAGLGKGTRRRGKRARRLRGTLALIRLVDVDRIFDVRRLVGPGRALRVRHLEPNGAVLARNARHETDDAHRRALEEEVLVELDRFRRLLVVRVGLELQIPVDDEVELMSLLVIV